MSDPASTAQSASQTQISSSGQLWGALVPAAALALIYCSAFLIARKRVPDVYDPKRQKLRLLRNLNNRCSKGAPSRLKEAASALTQMPADPPLTVWQWLSHLWRMEDNEILLYVGADAYMYLRFLRLGVQLFSVLCVLGVCVLLPVNFRSGSDARGLDTLSMSNVSNRSNALWAHFAATYVFSLLALTLLHREYKLYVDLRQRYLHSPTAQAHSLLVRSIPLQARPTIREYITDMVGHDVVAVHLVLANKLLQRYQKLVQQRGDMIIQLTRALEQEQSRRKRPTHNIWVRTFIVCFKPQKVDSITYYTDKIAELNKEIKSFKEGHKLSPGSDVGGAAFVTLDSIRVATACRAICWQQDVTELEVTEAPAPESTIWHNLLATGRSRTLRSLLVWAAVVALILGYAIPVGFVASLTNLRQLSTQRHFTWLRPLVDFSPPVTAFLSGFLPPLVLSIFFSLVPSIMKCLTMHQNVVSEAVAENGAIFKVYLFTLLDVFLAYTFAGTFISNISKVIDLGSHPTDLIDLLARTLPAQSTFFINYVMIATFTGLPSELIRLSPLIVINLKKRVLMPSRAIWDDLRLLTSTKGFHELYSFPLVVFLVGICYAVTAPLILVFVLAYFLMAYTTWLHQLLYVYQPTCHTGASQWPVVYGCCISALAIFEGVMIGILGLKRMALPAALTVPLLIGTIVYGMSTTSSFRRVGEVPTLWNLMHTDGVYDEHTRTALAEAFDPLLDADLEDELSRETIQLLADPYGVLYQGLIMDTEEHRKALRACNIATTAVGEKGGYQGVDAKQACANFFSKSINADTEYGTSGKYPEDYKHGDEEVKHEGAKWGDENVQV